MEAKKKVLIFIPTFPAVSETFIEREISKLVERNKADYIVYSLKKGKGYLSSNLNDKVLYKPLTVFRAVKAIPFLIKNLLRFSKLINILKEDNFGLMLKIYYVLVAYAYAHQMKILKADFILSHFLSHPSTLILLISKILDIPFGISAHAKDIFVEAELVKTKVKEAEFILICNKYAYQKVLELSSDIDNSNVLLKYHGIDFEKLFKMPYENIKKPEVPVISSVGTRLTEKKGLEYLVRASAVLKERNISHIVYLGGPGPLYKKLKKLILDLRVEDTVKIVGEGEPLDFSKVLGYYKITDIYAFPSIDLSSGDTDGIANVLAEAASFKIPIVATDAGSTLEIIQNKQTGLCVDQKDPDSLAGALGYLIKNPEIGKKLAENAYNKITRIFDLNTNVVEIEKLLNV